MLLTESDAIGLGLLDSDGTKLGFVDGFADFEGGSLGRDDGCHS
jgi:hypothetical protein